MCPCHHRIHDDDHSKNHRGCVAHGHCLIRLAALLFHSVHYIRKRRIAADLTNQTILVREHENSIITVFMMENYYFRI